MRATPAAEATLSRPPGWPARSPVGSHHLLLAALADSDSAAARALQNLGVDLDQARRRCAPLRSPAPPTNSQNRPAAAR